MGWDLLWDLGFWSAAGRQGSLGPRARRMAGGKGLSLSPGERLREGGGCALCPAKAWHGGGGHLDVGSIWMHTQIKSWCARNLEAGAVSHGEKASEGRRGTPQKTLDRKEVPRSGPGMRGGKRRQPPAEHPARGWATLGSGQSPFIPSRAPCKPPAHRPQPGPFLPVRGCGRGGRGAAVCRRGCESQAMQLWCSTAQGPEGTRLSHATVIPSVAVTGNKQGQNTETKTAGWRGEPRWQPPSDPQLAPSQGGLRWDRCPSAREGTDPGFACLPASGQGLSWGCPPRPDPGPQLPTFCLDASLQHSRAALTRGCSREVGTHCPRFHLPWTLGSRLAAPSRPGCRHEPAPAPRHVRTGERSHTANRAKSLPTAPLPSAVGKLMFLLLKLTI